MSTRTGPQIIPPPPSVSAAVSKRLVNQIGKRNYRYCDDSDDDDNDVEGYSIDPSIQLFKSIDFGRNRSKSELKDSVHKEEKRPPNNQRSGERNVQSNRNGELNPALSESGPLMLGAGAFKLNEKSASNPGATTPALSLKWQSEKERQGQKASTLMATQLAQERLELQRRIDNMAMEKAELAEKLKHMARDSEREAKQATMDMANQLADERLELQKRIDNMAAEKNELMEKLKEAERSAVEKENLMSERLAKELNDLKATVQRMKEEMLAERMSGGEPMLQHTSSHLALKPSKSLYDLMEEGDHQSSMRLGNKTSHSINVIPEGDEDVIGTGGGLEELPGVEGSFVPLVEEGSDDGDDEDEEEMFSDLPAPHAAAASGDVERLKTLGKLEASLLCSFDAANRSPLFYAVAYDKVDVARYLLELSPTVATAADMHGDSPLHAAASAASAECLDVLFQEAVVKADGNADPRNHMGMTPAHLASSAECLAVLFKYGADMAAIDDNGRTPLFVACAMNRIECAEFLVNCLDQTETNLLTKDNRGDTPLHAAACNGSVDCLLLLLQFGIDPTVTNEKGLKAIELAVRNKQKKCAQLLAEYHLHYNTSSDFDSVLFLATLEGHKQVRGLGKSGEDGAYRIIKKKSSEPGEDLSEKTEKALARVQSLFSLRHGKSLRLQRWGPWIAYEDQISHKVYWYNHLTCSGQWDKPEEVARQQLASSRNEGSSRALLTKASMRLKKIGDWIQYMTETGQTFYYNDKNGEFQWVNPEADPEGTSKAESGNWKPYKDPDSGAIFWHNVVTNVSQWECPSEAIPVGVASGGGGWDASAYEAVEVLNEDDLGI